MRTITTPRTRSMLRARGCRSGSVMGCDVLRMARRRTCLRSGCATNAAPCRPRRRTQPGQRILASVAPQVVEDFEKVREGLRYAAGVCDLDARCRETDDGEAHGHPMVVVRFHSRRLRRAWMHDETIALLFGADAESLELGDHRGDAVRFLLTNEADPRDARRALG